MRRISTLSRQVEQLAAQAGGRPRASAAAPSADDCLNALRTFEAGAVTVRLGEQVLTRADYAQARAESDAKARAFRIEVTRRGLADAGARAAQFEQAGPSCAGIARQYRADESRMRDELARLEAGTWRPWEESRARRLAQRQGRAPGA